jgi:hypothetical protein
MIKTNINQVQREEVFSVVADELQYQYELFGSNPHEIDAFATYIRRYSAELDLVVTMPNTPEAKLAVVRKIAAIAVRCMEQHGAPRRGPKPANPYVSPDAL